MLHALGHRSEGSVAVSLVTEKSDELNAYRSASERAMPTNFSIAGVPQAALNEEAERQWRTVGGGAGSFYTENEGPESAPTTEPERLLPEVRITDATNDVPPEVFRVPAKVTIEPFRAQPTAHTDTPAPDADGETYRMGLRGEVHADDPTVELPVAAQPDPTPYREEVK